MFFFNFFLFNRAHQYLVVNDKNLFLFPNGGEVSRKLPTAEVKVQNHYFHLFNKLRIKNLNEMRGCVASYTAVE